MKKKIRENLKKIMKNVYPVKILYEFLKGFFAWFLNYIVSTIPFWFIRRFFYIASGMKIGKGARIGLHTRVIRPEKIVIGDRTIINEYCHLDGRGGLKIEHDSSISIYTKIITASHRANSDQFEYYEKNTIIKERVWIGCSAIILDGSHIKKGCIIGAGAVIKGETEEYGIYVGNPAQKIKERNNNIDYSINYHPFFK